MINLGNLHTLPVSVTSSLSPPEEIISATCSSGLGMPAVRGRDPPPMPSARCEGGLKFKHYETVLLLNESKLQLYNLIITDNHVIFYSNFVSVVS